GMESCFTCSGESMPSSMRAMGSFVSAGTIFTRNGLPVQMARGSLLQVAQRLQPAILRSVQNGLGGIVPGRSAEPLLQAVIQGQAERRVRPVQVPPFVRVG